MNFLERPKMVTAVVFFLETILALLKIEYFLFLSFGNLVLSLVLLAILPFGFHAIYSYILNELEPKEKAYSHRVENPKAPEKLSDEMTETHPTSSVIPTDAPAQEKNIQILKADDIYQEDEDTTSADATTPSRMDRKRK